MQPRHFAQSASRLSGAIELRDMTRLHDLLSSQIGVVSWWMEGGTEAGLPVLRLGIDAQLSLICQRCLGPLSYSLHSESALPIARDEGQLKQWESEDPLLDGLIAEPHQSVHDLIEDEVLLSLPVIAMHDEGACQPVQAH
jgi:uncharacterized protein